MKNKIAYKIIIDCDSELGFRKILLNKFGRDFIIDKVSNENTFILTEAPEEKDLTDNKK